MDVEGTLEGLQQYTLHGALWYRAFFTLAGDPDTIQQAQLPSDAFDESLKPGDPIVVTLLLRTVMQIRQRSPDS